MSKEHQPNNLGRAEADYWNIRGPQEFAGRVEESYRENWFGLDPWQMYEGYAKWVRTLPKDAPILEVGAGTVAKGTYLALFEGYTNVTVSDIAIEQMRMNREFSIGAGLEEKIEHVAADMYSLPFQDEVFSCVFVHSALHHLPDTERSLREMVRCLQPGGLLIIGHEPNRNINKVVRGVADFLHLSEKYHELQHSEADDELAGLDPAELVQLARAQEVQVLEVLPHWYMMGLIHPIPLVLERLSGIQKDFRPPLRAIAKVVDPKLSRLPGIRNFSFYFSLVGQRR